MYVIYIDFSTKFLDFQYFAGYKLLIVNLCVEFSKTLERIKRNIYLSSNFKNMELSSH